MSLGSRDEAYWLGVRDALRMIDSFLKWSRRNPEKAKELDDFLNEALISAAKRCESCLSRALGISFSRTAGEVPEMPERPPAEGPPIDLDHTDPLFEQTPLERVLSEAEAAYRRAESSPGPEVVPEHETDVPDLDEVVLSETALPEAPSEPTRTESVEPEVETSSEPDVSGPSIDFLEARGPPAESYETEGDKRAFDSDFDLMEPGPFDTESRPEEPGTKPGPAVTTTEEPDTGPVKGAEEPSVSFELSEERLPEALDQLERDFSSHGLSISPTEMDLDTDLSSGEEAPSESKEPEGESAETSVDELSIPVESDETGPEDIEIEQHVTEVPREPESVPTPETEEVWGPDDLPSAPADDFIPPDLEEELPDVTPEKPEVKPDELESRPPPPPPPPPPESDETDEERRKRARRLFFGT